LDVIMMSLTEPETQALGSIADGLAGSDPRLASMLNVFSRLAAGEEMPAREKTRHPRRGTALPQPRRLYPRLGWQQAMLLLWAVISAALLTIALVLNASGHNACIQSMETACPSSPSHSGPGSTFGRGIAAQQHSTRQAPSGDA
jgi:hypothetical protein